MAIPQADVMKSKKNESSDRNRESGIIPPSVFTKTIDAVDDSVVKIRPIACCNDFIAILRSQINTTIALSTDESSFKNEGIVVGVGPGLADNAGGRLKPTVDIGDVVMFGAKNIIAEIESSAPPYEGKRVIIVSERNLLCKLNRKVEFEICGE